MNRHLILALATLLTAPAALSAQSSPFLDDARFEMLAAELSGDRAYESIRALTPLHRTGGSDDFFAAAEWIRAQAQASGLDDVRLVRQPLETPGWTCVSGAARIVSPREELLADCRAVALSIADHSRTTHVTGTLVDVGGGVLAADYDDLEVEGRIVLASGSPGAVHAQAVWKRGALGVISYATNRTDMLDAPDQIAWGRVPYVAEDADGVEDGTPSTFAVMVSPRRGLGLRARLARGELIEVKVDIESRHREPAEQAYVEAFLRGTQPGRQQIVLTAHIQEEKGSANDDASGCASLLEIGRALARLVGEGRLPRPQRDVRFWWVNEFASQERVFRDHPEEIDAMLLNVNQDMVGARQSWGGRVQYASRLPWSLPHPLDDVMESILGLVRDGNTELLTMRGTGLPVPFTREVTALLGSREPYHARMVPYFDFTDHHAFTPAWIGVPGTSLTNWPDDWIHSTGDDLPNVDATQLERNALVVAGVALYFASLPDDALPALALRVAGNGLARASAHAATATGHLLSAAADERGAAWRRAESLIREAFNKERSAVAATLTLGDTEDLRATLETLLRRMDEAEAFALRNLRVTWVDATGEASPPEPVLDATERAMAGKVFGPVDDLVAVMDGVDAMGSVGELHPMMRFEVLNFADGHRTALEVYEAVAAQALAAGEWYYGDVRPAEVLRVLEAAVANGAFRVREIGP